MFETEPFLPARLWLRLADFAHPRDVVTDAELSPQDKREILACWASDAHVPESRPALRWLPGTPGPVPLRSVLAALAALDRRTSRETAPSGAVLAAFAAQRRGTISSDRHGLA